MAIQRFPEQRVAITGGATGLGLALAKQFLHEGWSVAIADIQDEKGQAEIELLGLPESRLFFTKVDVTKEAQLKKWRDDIVKRWGGVDIIINNAGVATHGAIDEAPLSDWEWVLDINLMGVVRGCRVFTPLFKKQRSGHIVNIASMAGLIHAPEMGSYNAAKAGVVALSETLEGELFSYGIGVSVVCPGFFQTDLGKTLRSPDPKAKDMVQRLFETSKIDADGVAKRVYSGINDKDFYVLPHKSYHLIWMLKRYLPAMYMRSLHVTGRKILQKKRDWQASLATLTQP
ncbi:SDR family oxidoreductase [Allohahella marinimesophila]|uniref:SDR family oxidoreductase n=1 Tax=Allohahella marinimesophila TaxID=1054972 RepID=A0ABP7P8P2_9GAMM